MKSWKLKSVLLATMVLAMAATAFYLVPGAHKSAASLAAKPSHPAVSAVSLPLFFESNQGQTDPRVKFLARGSGYGLFLTANEAVLELQPSAVSHQPSAGQVIRMKLADANPAAKVTGAEPLPGKSNYFIGNDPKTWRHNVPHYGRVEYRGVYPGVDLAYYGNQRQLEYDFRVGPWADARQIAMTFDGARARLESGDLLLATGQGDVRFLAPRIYQQEGSRQIPVEGRFHQLAENKIGFAIGNYDHSRELIIDPVLNYSTYLGGSGIEEEVRVALGSDLDIYVAGTTNSADFPIPPGVTPFQGPPNRQLDVFIAKLNPSAPSPAQQLVYATYLGGSGDDHAAGIAVDSSLNVYVAGWTTSPDFPTNGQNAPFQGSATGTHGFLSRLDLTTNALIYSTYLAGNGADTVTALAIDNKQDAFVTGTTTSTNDISNGFPANGNAYQPVSNAANQLFASKVNTNGTGSLSMLYSTYFGGGYPANSVATGGGIAVDTSGNIYITGATNFIGVPGPNGEPSFPMANAQQTCLNQPGINTGCTDPLPGVLDAFVAKINPNRQGASGLVYSTFLGGSGDDIGYGVAVDSSNNAYVTGQTASTDWNVAGNAYLGGPSDAFVAKVTSPPANSTIYPLTFFNYVGGSGTDIGRAIAVDSVQAAHITGSTDSPGLQGDLGGSGIATDAFVGLVSTTAASGNYLEYLGGSGFDEGTGIALDPTGDGSPTIVAGDTQSNNFPLLNAYQAGLNGSQDAFVASVGGSSGFAEVSGFPKASPDPATVGNQVTFTFEYVNNGPDPASNVIFVGNLPPISEATFTSASSSPGGTCGQPVNSKITCFAGNVAKGAQVTVTIILVPTVGTTSVTVTPSLSANGDKFVNFLALAVPVSDFTVTAAPSSITVKAGESASYTVTLTPVPTYTSAISVAFTSSPTLSAVTSTFNPPSPITISGNSPATTVLNIATTPRPVNQGSLMHRAPIYAIWLPIGGISLLGAGWSVRQRRRGLLVLLLVLLAGLVVLQVACGSSSSTPAPTGGTPAGTYTLTVTGSSGSASHNVPVTLIVQ